MERLAKVLNRNTELKNIVAMIDSIHIKVRMHSIRVKGDNPDMGRTRDFNSKVHIVVYSE